MKFKKVDILISENLTKAQLKEKVLPELNKIANKESSDGQTIHYVANIHDLYKGKYWVCMDTETKETLNAQDELIDLHSVMRYTVDDRDLASVDFLYSSRYVEDNFLRTEIFNNFAGTTDSRLNLMGRQIETNENDIEDKHTRLLTRVANLETYKTNNTREVSDLTGSYLAFKNTILNTLAGIDNALKTKIDITARETVENKSSTTLNINIDSNKVIRLSVTGDCVINLENSVKDLYAEKRLILENRAEGAINATFRWGDSRAEIFNLSGGKTAYFNLDFIDATTLVSQKTSSPLESQKTTPSLESSSLGSQNTTSVESQNTSKSSESRDTSESLESR